MVDEFLTEWTQTYYEQKDLYHKKIVCVDKDKEECDLVIEFKDKKLCLLVQGKLSIADIKDSDEPITVVVYNTKENLSALFEGWDELKEKKHISILFVNPFAHGDTKWTIYPYTHDRITEKESLELGIKALFSSVELLTERQIESNIK